MQGKIIKGISGFYYIHVAGSGIYECKAKGVFRNQNIKPLVGDNVEIAVLDEEHKKGNIEKVLPRENELIRPAVANIDLALIIFAAAKPQPNFNLLDKFLVMMDYQDVPTVVVFNKTDLVEEKDIEALRKIYEKCGCKVIFISAYDNTGIDILIDTLKDKTTILAGPSGVGKSSLTNIILPDRKEEGEISKTGDVSRIGRGRHTTRHSEIFNVTGSTYICDTPGFTSLNLPELEKEQVRFYFNEFDEYEGTCRFNGCVHINEPDCAVKMAVEKGVISRRRYTSYVELYEEIKNQKKY